MNGLALQVQEAMKRDPHAGDLYVFRGRRGNLVKILWHDGLGMSLYAKRLEHGKFIWPSPANNAAHSQQRLQCTRCPHRHHRQGVRRLDPAFIYDVVR
jgi:transposase